MVRVYFLTLFPGLTGRGRYHLHPHEKNVEDWSSQHMTVFRTGEFQPDVALAISM